MTTQPDTLLLAAALEWPGCSAETREEAAAELRRLHEENEALAAGVQKLNALCAEWERKAATWFASPEAAQRLGGYRELAQRVSMLEQANQELLEVLEAAESSLSDYHQGAEWGAYDLEMLNKARTALAKHGGEA